MNYDPTEHMTTSAQASLRPATACPYSWLLLDGQNRHVGPDDIYDQHKSGPEKLSRGTVCNALRQFCDAGLLCEVHGVGDTLVYDATCMITTIF